jgi:AcrR family transcriptional regulator
MLMRVLIQEKGFEALSVQDTIDRANVGRPTFYALFRHKEDLLLSLSRQRTAGGLQAQYAGMISVSISNSARCPETSERAASE